MKLDFTKFLSKHCERVKSRNFHQTYVVNAMRFFDIFMQSQKLDLTKLLKTSSFSSKIAIFSVLIRDQKKDHRCSQLRITLKYLLVKYLLRTKMFLSFFSEGNVVVNSPTSTNRRNNALKVLTENLDVGKK